MMTPLLPSMRWISAMLSLTITSSMAIAPLLSMPARISGGILATRARRSSTMRWLDHPAASLLRTSAPKRAARLMIC